MSNEDINKLLSEVKEKCLESIKSKEMNTECLEKRLNEIIPSSSVNIDDDWTNDYTIKVTVRLPPFVPCLNSETGELWYVCTKEDIDLAYRITSDGKYHFVGDEDIIELIKDGEIG